MGVTVFKDAVVGVIRNGGESLFALYEQTYQKGHPSTEDWDVVYFGGVQGAIEWVFRSAQFCEFRVLQGVIGEMKPERYIQRWMKELSNPRLMREEHASIWIGGDAAPIPSKYETQVLSVLREGKMEDVADALQARKVVGFSLFNDTELLRLLCSAKSPLRANKVLSCYPLLGAVSPEHGYAPKTAKPQKLDVPQFRKIEAYKDGYLILRNGTWRYEGTGHSIVASYIANMWSTELMEPGSCTARIKAFRDALYGASTLIVDDARVVVDLDGLKDDAIVQEAARPPEWMRTSVEPNGYSFALSEGDVRSLWFATQLPCGCATWVIPSEQPELEMTA